LRANSNALGSQTKYWRLIMQYGKSQEAIDRLTAVNAGVKMYRRAGVKLHHGWTPNAPTARLCCTTNRMRSDCLTGECFRDFEPA
jgi:hypothetical protein